MPQTIKRSELSVVIDESADGSSFAVRFDKTNTSAPFTFMFEDGDGKEITFPVSATVWHKLFAWLTEREQSRSPEALLN
jgi:hypothetical protein